MSEETKTIARRFVEEFVGGRNISVAKEIFAPGFVDHTAGSEADSGVDGFIKFFGMIQAGFPDFAIDVEDLFSEGDRVALRFTFRGTHQGVFMGIEPTGKLVTMAGIDILRIEDGKIVELWGHEDMLGMMEQLGAMEPTE